MWIRNILIVILQVHYFIWQLSFATYFLYSTTPWEGEWVGYVNTITSEQEVTAFPFQCHPANAACLFFHLSPTLYDWINSQLCEMNTLTNDIRPYFLFVFRTFSLAFHVWCNEICIKLCVSMWRHTAFSYQTLTLQYRLGKSRSILCESYKTNTIFLCEIVSAWMLKAVVYIITALLKLLNPH